MNNSKPLWAFCPQYLRKVRNKHHEKNRKDYRGAAFGRCMCFSLAGCYDEDLNWSAKYDDTELLPAHTFTTSPIAYNEAASKVSTEDEVLKCEIDGTPAETWIKNARMSM